MEECIELNNWGNLSVPVVLSFEGNEIVSFGKSLLGSGLFQELNILLWLLIAVHKLIDFLFTVPNVTVAYHNYDIFLPWKRHSFASLKTGRHNGSTFILKYKGEYFTTVDCNIAGEFWPGHSTRMDLYCKGGQSFYNFHTSQCRCHIDSSPDKHTTIPWIWDKSYFVGFNIKRLDHYYFWYFYNYQYHSMWHKSISW